MTKSTAPSQGRPAMRWVVEWHLVRDGTRFWLGLSCGHYRVVPREGRDAPGPRFKCYRCAAGQETGVQGRPKWYRAPKRQAAQLRAEWARWQERRKALGLDRREPVGDELS